MNYYLNVRRNSTPDTIKYLFWTNAMDALGIPATGSVEYIKGCDCKPQEFDFVAKYEYDNIAFIEKLNEHNLSLIQEIRDIYGRTYYFK